jgi:acyl-coenzyme A synthetase/AMP-(fatty) acid ligase
MTALKLLLRDPGEPIAIRRGAIVTAAEFLSQVHGLAAALPSTGCVINVCEDRYRFLVGFAAALARGLTTLLPPNALDATVSRIQHRWPDYVVLTDRPGASPGARLVVADESLRGAATNPDVPAQQLAAVTFTSGSTGEPTPQRKSWRTLVAGTALNLPHFLGAGAGPHAVVATVPAQHMYGFETTALAALRGPVTMHDGRPFYPANVAAALDEAPAPRVLVSTPVHLRALIGSGLRFAPLARVLSATAPLDAALARAVEDALGAELVEIYGCTEVGSMADRHTSSGAPWRFFAGIGCTQRDGVAWVSAPHVDGEVRLLDALEFEPDGRFVLAGRDSDLVKVGGKRTSLAEVTRLLLAVPGVEDAVAVQLPAVSGEARLAALVVAPGLDAAVVRAALARTLEPLFIPRRIVIVAALPRSATGKLSHEAVMRVYGEATGATAPVEPPTVPAGAATRAP